MYSLTSAVLGPSLHHLLSFAAEKRHTPPLSISFLPPPFSPRHQNIQGGDYTCKHIGLKSVLAYGTVRYVQNGVGCWNNNIRTISKNCAQARINQAKACLKMAWATSNMTSTTIIPMHSLRHCLFGFLGTPDVMSSEVKWSVRVTLKTTHNNRQASNWRPN